MSTGAIPMWGETRWPRAAAVALRVERSRVLAYSTGAVLFAFALVALPGPKHDRAELGLAAGLAVAVVVVAALGRRLPAAGRLGAPLTYVAFVAVLIDGGGGTNSGFGGLYLLPLLWLAIVGSRLELGVGLAAVLLARVLPVRIVGAPDYPASTWRFALVLGAVAVIACVTIQQYVRDARVRAAELLAHAAQLEEAARQLESQNAQLRELDHVKDEFVALVSHELRTPLTSIAGYLEMVIETGADPLTAEQRRFLTAVGRNVDRLAALVDELLFLVQVDAGRFELTLADTKIDSLLADAVEAASPAAEAKKIAIDLDVGGLATVVCDRGRIAQLVDNLVSNAVKFTPEGGRITVRAAQEGGDVALSVRDTGIGIPSDELPRLFNRFYRASSATSRAIPGTGLGLAISQAIAEAHGSRITVESVLDRGTTFRLRLAGAS